MKIEIDDDFENMMISAIRYGLWRRTYITKLTADYIIPLVKKRAFSPRALVVMEKDLTRYEDDRKFRLEEYEKFGKEKQQWTLDDECDFKAWSELHKAVHETLIEMGGEDE